MNHPVASERFARHALGTQYEDLSDDAVLQAKTFILDTMGVGIAGSSAAGADELSQVSAGWGEGAEACVWGRRRRVPAPTAAFLNGFQVHCQEYDCLHEKAVLHAMATLLPATIAYAERMGGASGRELIAAVVVGIDVAVNLGVAAREGLKFFRPATSGGFGATAAIARLGRFDLDTLCNAFGIQYGQTSGTMQAHVEGSIVLPMQIGFNSRAAIQSCDMAASRLSGPRDVFEGQFGYMRLYEGSFQCGHTNSGTRGLCMWSIGAAFFNALDRGSSRTCWKHRTARLRYFHVAMMGNESKEHGGSDERLVGSDCPTLPFD